MDIHGLVVSAIVVLLMIIMVMMTKQGAAAAVDAKGTMNPNCCNRGGARW